MVNVEDLPDISTRLTDAFRYAEELHRGQKRKKTNAPTLSHLMGVSTLVMENGGDEDQAIAALLHDGPEDSGGRPIMNRSMTLVVACSTAQRVAS